MAVRLDAAADRLTHTGAYPEPDVAITVTAWVRVDVDRDDYSTIWRLHTSGSQRSQLATDADGVGLMHFGSATVGTGFDLPVGQWARVAIAGSGGTITVYRATARGSVTSSGGPISSASAPDAICLGGIGGNPAEWLNGSLAHVRIWSAQLTQAEIENEWASPEPLRTADLHSDWPLTDASDLTDTVGGKTLAVQSGGALTTTTGPRLGNMLNPSLWAVDPDDGSLTALPHFTRLAVSEVRNGIGKVEVDYPVYGRNFDLLAATTREDRDVEVEVWLVGRQEHAVRGMLTDTAGDDTAEDAVWAFEGWDLNVLLDEVLVWPQVGTDKQELVLSANDAGTIVAALIAQAQARGGLVGVTAGFTGSVDSNGDVWANVVTATFSPSATLLDVLQELIEIGMIDGFRLGPDRVLDMWNPGSQGADRTVTTPPVIFRRGRNLTESPRRHTVRNSATTALVAGGDNLYEDADDATALARRGRRIEVAGSSNSLKDSGSVTGYAQALLSTITPGAHEVTHGLILGPDRPIPWIDYEIADWVWSDTRNALDRLRIQQLELEYGPGGYAGSVVLNTAVVDRVSAIARKLKRISSGTAVVGTSVTAPEVDDGKSPAQVTGVAASSAAYLANDGITWASVQAGWTAVTTNADTSLADDIVGYLPAYRYGTGQSLPTAWQVQGQVDGTAADWSGVVAGKTVDVRVAAVDKWGHVGAWSSAYSLTSGADATPPPTPSTPNVDSYLGLLTVAWDGLGSVGQTQPPDFARVDVHVSTSSGFTPSSGNKVDSLRAAGTVAWDGGSYGVTYYGKLVAYDKTGNASAASAQDSAVLTQAGDGDIAALSIGKLTAGTATFIAVLAGELASSSSGAGWVLDSAGIYLFDTGGNTTVELDAASGDVYVRGTIEAYQSANDRIVFQPSGSGSSGGSLPEISFYAQPTSPAYQNAFDAGSGRTGLGINSGNSADSGTTRRQTTLQLRPTFYELYYNTAPGDTAGASARRGGSHFGSSSVASMALYNSSGNLTGAIEIDTTISAEWFGGTGATNGGYWRLRPDGSDTYFGHETASLDGYLRFANSGQVTLNAGSNTFIRLTDGGNIGFFENGTGYSSLANLKSFVIDHPLDEDRLLVHVCTESPVAGVEYTGHATIVDGRGEVELPDYFEALCEEEGRTVQLTPVGELCRVAYEPIVDGGFTVLSDAPDGTRVDWLVKATRKNATFDVEPLRTDVTVAGSGPYRWISPEPVLTTATVDETTTNTPES